MLDEDGASAFHHPRHAAVQRGDLHDALDHLDRAALLVDDDREGGSLDDRRQHRSIDGEVRNSGVLNLEQQGAQSLDHAREAGRLRGRGKLQLAARSHQDIVTAMDECCAPGRARRQNVAGRKLVAHLQRRGLGTGMHNSSVAAELGDNPDLIGCSGGDCRRSDQEEQRKERQGQLVHR